MTVWIYMLECADGSYYIGSHRGAGLDRRIEEHQAGKYSDSYTFRRRPVKLVWSDWFGRIDDAIAVERKIKGWSRAKKQALIAGDFDMISWFAKRPTARKRIRQDASS